MVCSDAVRLAQPWGHARGDAAGSHRQPAVAQIGAQAGVEPVGAEHVVRRERLLCHAPRLPCVSATRGQDRGVVVPPRAASGMRRHPISCWAPTSTAVWSPARRPPAHPVIAAATGDAVLVVIACSSSMTRSATWCRPVVTAKRTVSAPMLSRKAGAPASMIRPAVKANSEPARSASPSASPTMAWAYASQSRPRTPSATMAFERSSHSCAVFCCPRAQATSAPIA